MKRSHGNSLFLRTLALVMAIGLLLGAVPVAAVESQIQAEDESTSSAVEEIPAQEETKGGDDLIVPDDAGDHIVKETTPEEEEGAGVLLESKGDTLLAETAEAPAGVDITVNKGSYKSSSDYYYTGIDSIVITFTKPEDLPAEKIKAACYRNMTETQDYSAIEWWNNYSNLDDYITVSIDSSNFVTITMDFEGFAAEKYDSDFTDEKADGLFTLVFPYDADSSGDPIIDDSRQFVISNKKPVVTLDYTDGGKWVSNEGKITYTVTDAVSGLAKVYLWKAKYDNYNRSSNASDTFTITESGQYYLTAKDNLGNVSEKIDAGEINIEKKDPEISEDDISYPEEADPDDPNAWSSDPVDVTFKVTDGGSGMKQVKAKDKTLNPNDKGEYTLRFDSHEDIEVTMTSNAGREAKQKIAAPHIDKENPSKDSITHIGFSTEEANMFVHVLTFGIYSKKELKMTVYTEDESPIKEIAIAGNDLITKDGEIVRNDKESAQTFTIPLGDSVDNSDFSDINIQLTDMAGNQSDAKITWKDIKRFTVKDDNVEKSFDNIGETIKEMVNTKLTPDVTDFKVTGETSEDNPGYYRNNVKVTADISEPLTGIESAKAYFGTEDDFTFDAVTKEYQEKESAKDISDKLKDSKKSGEKIEGKRLEYKIEPDSDLPTGKYLVLIKATNNSGNEMQKVKEFYVDKEAPVITVTSAPEKWTDDNKLTFTVNDEPSGEGAHSVGVAKVTVKGDADTPETSFEISNDGKYEFTPKAGESYTINAEDLLGNKAEEVTVSYGSIKFDDKAPVIGDFKYYDKDGHEMTTEDQWSDKVTVKFTINDKFDGKTLSGFDFNDTSTFVITKKDTTDVLDITVDTKAGENDTYVCSFVVPHNYTAYSVKVKDKVGNYTAIKDTKTINRDDEPPVIDKIVFSGFSSAKEFGMYGSNSLKATVYTMPRQSAPVAQIDLFNDTDPLTKDGTIGKDGEFFTQSFVFKDVSDDKIGTVYDALKIKATSAAGVLTEQGIKATNIYAEGVEGKFDKFLEAVAKLSGPAIELDGWTYPAEVEDTEKSITISGYKYEDGVFDGDFGTFSFNVNDSIAGVKDDTIMVYFDKKSNFTANADGIYEPKDGAARLNDITKTPTTDNTTEKNTSTTCEYQASEATPGGEYVLCVKADNLSGVTKTASKVFYVDDNAPVIDQIKYDDSPSMNNTWSNEKVKVTFDVNDMPTGENSKIKNVTVVGEKDGLSPDDLTHDGSKYTFNTGISQKYIITAWDNLNIKTTVTTDRVLTDLDAPHVTISDAKLKEYTGKWTADTKDITFTVDDIWAYDKFEDEADKKLSGINSIEVKGANGTKYGFDDVTTSADRTEYTFEADLYQDYTITVKDNAGNTFVYDKLTNIKVDKIAPAIKNISFDKEDKSTLNKLLHFLTFGIFGDEKVSIKVEGTDPFASSSIDKVIVRFYDAKDNEKVKEAKAVVTGGDPNEATINATIAVPEKLVSNSNNITVEVLDKVGHTSGEKSLFTLFGENKVTIPDGFKIDKQDFEVVVTDKAPEINSISVKSNNPGNKDAEIYTDNSDKTFESAHNGEYWYNNNNFSVDFTAKDTVSKLHSVDVALNNTNITDDCYEGGTETKLDSVYTNFEKTGEHNDQYVTEKAVTINASKLTDQSNLRYVSQGNAANEFSITAIGNNGIPKTVDVSNDMPKIHIDDKDPDITAFSFADTVEPSREKADKTEEKEISEALAKGGVAYNTMTSDNYVYFFQDEAKVTVSATDNHSGVTGSGVREIHFYAVGRKTADADVKVYDYDPVIKADNYGNMSATFTIPAGFKGSIFAYAVDQVKNRGSQYSPNNLVVENRDVHDSSSGADITINTESVATDNHDYPLYDRDVNLTFTIEDQFSGIRSVSYSCIGLESSASLEGSAYVNRDGDVSDDLGEWDVASRDKNLVLKMSRTITLDGDGDFNSNSIVIKISGYDCSGYQIAEETKTISIDTTDPVIEVSYDPVKGSGNTYGTDEYEYYKTSRTMNVTVLERNFDPSGFDYSGILNQYVSGDVPSLIAGEDWDTDYSDYTDNSSHSCSFTFANDGDYDITLNCTDEAGNKAEEYIGEKFTIDTIDPTVEVSLSGTAKNGKYYNETVTATVTVHEHNFAEGDTYVTFTPKTDFDTSYDKSSATPSISGWSGSGDTHTTTIDFSSDGTYSFTFDYKDKALREAQQFSQTEFVVDKNIDKLIKFIDVENTTAYDGKIAPKVSFDDTNLDTATSSMTRISLDTTDLKQSASPASNLKHAMNPSSGSSRTDAYEDFPQELVNDGIYEFEASGTDMAGNSKSEKIIFSVNRFGSTFMLSAQSREWVDTGYVNKQNQLDVIEINVNEVTDQSVSVTRNSQTATLNKDKFKFSSTGDNENWYRYDYNVYDSNFAQDGEYTVTVSSTDTFKKSVSNRTAVNDADKGIEKNCPISFVMDTDDPIIKIDGVESNTPYGEPEKTVNIICADSNIDSKTLVIKDDDNELISGSDYTLEEHAGELDIELIVDKPGKHSLSVYVADKATNGNEDEVTNFELNASIFTLFFHNTAAVIATAIGLVALIALAVFLILRKKKKDPVVKP